MINSIYIRACILVLVVPVLFIQAYSQVDVPRKTTAVTYPMDETVLLPFRGTTRFPRMKGEARIRRTARNGTRIELSVEKMPRPFELGAGYATYVLWAISPDGQVDNLGEIKRSGFFLIDSKISVTTPLQTFALIITAEPHFLVSRPSQEIMLENLYPITTESGKRLTMSAAIQYFGNSSDYFRDPRTPEIAETDYSKTPQTILEAKQAVALAKFAGADRDAPAELADAETLLKNAEDEWNAERPKEEIDITARKAIGAAVKAEMTAAIHREAREKRNEKNRTDAEIRDAENKFVNAQNEIASLKDELARETRNRELAERDALNFSNQVKDLRAENQRLSEELGRVKVEAETANAKLTALENEKKAIQEQSDKFAKAAKLKAAENDLMTALRAFGTVVKSERGIVLTLPETLWMGTRSFAFSPQADGRLASLAQILVNNPDYRISIESHTDNAGTPDQIQMVTERRSFAIQSKFAAVGIDEGRIVAKGFGASIPIVPNTTAVNRAKNRRLKFILTFDLT